jgi:two-component system C4-dicarboxylate transport response regulator DctD
VDVAAGGAEALERARSRWYDAILLDLRMPHMSGGEVYAALRARDPELAARVVFATGDADSDAARRFLRESGRPVARKPFDLAAVADLLVRADSERP